MRNRTLLIILLGVLLAGNCLVFGTLCALLNRYLPTLPTPAPTLTPLAVTPRPTFTALPTAVGRPTFTPLFSPTPKPTAPMATPTLKPSPTLYFGPPTPTNTRPPTATWPPTATPLPSRTPAPSATPTPSASPRPRVTPSPTPSVTPSPTPRVTPSPTPSVTPSPTPFLAPAMGLRARAADPARIELSWTAPADPRTQGYWVYSDDGSVGTQFHRLGWTTETSFTDAGLNPGFLYIYYVRAAAGESESRASNLAGVITQPLPSPTPAPSPTPSASPRPRVTPSPTPHVTAAPAPSVTPAPGRPLTFLVRSHRHYVDNFGELRIVGEVRNDFSVDAQAVVITAILYDDQGQRLEQVAVPTLLRFVRAGQRAPFLIVRPAPKGFHSYTLTVAGMSTSQAPKWQLVVAEKKQYEDSAGLYHVEGKVRNEGASAVDNVRAVVTIYNEEGDVVNAEAATTTPARLSSAQTGSFHVVVIQFPRAARYTVQVEGEP